MTTKNVLFNNCKELISLYLTTGDTLNYGKEIKIAKKLLSFYSIEFFQQYDVQTRFYSLSVFLTKSGRKELDKQFSLYNLTKPLAPIILEENPVIQLEEQSKNIKKSRNLQEFVDSVL